MKRRIERLMNQYRTMNRTLRSVMVLFIALAMFLGTLNLMASPASALSNTDEEDLSELLEEDSGYKTEEESQDEEQDIVTEGTPSEEEPVVSEGTTEEEPEISEEPEEETIAAEESESSEEVIEQAETAEETEAFEELAEEEKELQYRVLSAGNVTVRGNLPEDAELSVVEVPVQAVEAVVEGEVLAAYDISILSGGEKFQPEEFGETVQVSISSPAIASAGDVNLVHIDTDVTDGSGNLDQSALSSLAFSEIEKIDSSTYGETVFCTADSFSVYAVIDEPTLCTYEIYGYDEELLSSQIVKNGDTLYEPAVPEEADGKHFVGWVDEAGNEFTGFGIVSGVTETETKKVFANYAEKIVRIIYHDELDNVVGVQEALPNSTVMILPDSPVIETNSVTTCHDGWTLDKGVETDISGEYTLGEEDLNLYPIIKEGYWVTFESNGGTAINKQFIAKDAAEDEKKAVKPEPDPYKEGYSFGGWYADEGCTEEYDFEQTVTKAVIIYAKWIEDPNAFYRVEYYVEYQSDIESDTWDYKLVTSEVKKAQKGSDAEYDNNKIFTRPYSYDKAGYSLDTEKTEQDVKVAPDGSTVWEIYYQCNTYSITTIIPLEDGTTYTLTMPAKYTADLGYYWDEVAKYRDLDVLFDGAHRFEYGPKSFFVYSRNSLGTMTVTYSLTNGKWVGKPDRTLNYRFWCETLEGVAPAGREALPNHSARQQLGTISDSRTYYLEEEGAMADDPQLLTHSVYNYIKGFRVWLPYSDGNFFLYSNEWYIFFHAGTKYAKQIYGVTNEYGVNMYGYYPAGDSWENNAYYNDTDGYVDFYCPRESYNLIFHDGDEDPETKKVLYEKNLAEYDPAVTKPEEYTPGESKKTNPDGQVLVFDGWYADPQLTNKFDFASTEMPYWDIDLYAKWAPITYTVTFDSNGGSEVEPVTGVEYGHAIPKPEDPTLADHTFLGWTLNNRPYNFASGVTSDITLVAQWRSDKAYSVTYELNGGTGTAPKDTNKYFEDAGVTVQDIGDGVTPPEGKVFLGWLSSADNRIYYPGETVIMGMKDLVLKAQWGDQEDILDLTYDFNYSFYNIPEWKTKGTSETIHELVNNSKVETPEFSTFGEEPTLYRFKGWNTKPDGSGKHVDPGDPVWIDAVNKDTNVLYAEWEGPYTITYKLNGGTHNDSPDDIVEVYRAGTVISIHEAPVREGYTFQYWEGSEYYPGDKYTVKEDHTFTAMWAKSDSGSGGNSENKPTPVIPVPVQRIIIPNTYDPGFGRYITVLLSSAITAIIAAYALKKWN